MSAEACLHPGGLALTAHLLERAGLPTGSRILDAGCGAGATVDWLLSQGMDGYGIDLAPGRQDARVCQGNLQQLPYGEAVFDAVLSECTAFLCDDTAAMVAQCHRVLRPGGWLLLADVFAAEAEGEDDDRLTLAGWQRLMEQQGFVLEAVEDVSHLWKPFVIQQLWAGHTLESLWCGCHGSKGSHLGKKPGYLLLWARKPAADGHPAQAKTEAERTI